MRRPRRPAPTPGRASAHCTARGGSTVEARVPALGIAFSPRRPEGPPPACRRPACHGGVQCFYIGDGAVEGGTNGEGGYEGAGAEQELDPESAWWADAAAYPASGARQHEWHGEHAATGGPSHATTPAGPEAERHVERYGTHSEADDRGSSPLRGSKQRDGGPSIAPDAQASVDAAHVGAAAGAGALLASNSAESADSAAGGWLRPSHTARCGGAGLPLALLGGLEGRPLRTPWWALQDSSEDEPESPKELPTVPAFPFLAAAPVPAGARGCCTDAYLAGVRRTRSAWPTKRNGGGKERVGYKNLDDEQYILESAATAGNPVSDVVRVLSKNLEDEQCFLASVGTAGNVVSVKVAAPAVPIETDPAVPIETDSAEPAAALKPPGAKEALACLQILEERGRPAFMQSLRALGLVLDPHAEQVLLGLIP